MKLVRGAYQHVAAALGAFSMAVLFGEIFDLGWRGVLAKMVGIWDQYVRPPVKWVFDGLLWPLNLAFDWQIEVPVVVRDYCAVGLVLFFSWFRAVRGRAGLKRMVSSGSAAVLLICVTAWPIFVLLAMYVILSGMRDIRRSGDALDLLASYISRSVLYILPLLYLAFLFVINYLLL